MKSTLLIMSALIISYANSYSRSIYLSGGICYEPVGKLDYPQRGGPKTEFYDIIKYEIGPFIKLNRDFQLGITVGYSKKGIDPGGNTHSDLTIWDVNLISEYGYEFTESGRAVIVLGAETNYGHLADDGGYGTVSGGGFGVAGIIGWRYKISKKSLIEMDYRFSQKEISLKGDPEKTYEFSGSTIRLLFGYTIFNSENKD